MYLEQNTKNKWLLIALLGLITGGVLLLVFVLNRSSQSYQTPAASIAGTRSVVCKWDSANIPSTYALTIQLLDSQKRVIRAIPNPTGNSYTFDNVDEGSFPTTCRLDLTPNQIALPACVYEVPVTCVNLPSPTPELPTSTPVPTGTPGAPTNTPVPLPPTSTPVPGGPTSTPAPTNTPVPLPPTSTPRPGGPTNTPVPLPPTSTPVPGGPTSTPAPTNTPVPLAPPANPPFKLVNPPAVPTNTPVPLPPTSTPVPGGPTSTPAPTNTPVPVSPDKFPELPKAGINMPTMLVVAMGIVILLLAFAL